MEAFNNSMKDDHRLIQNEPLTFTSASLPSTNTPIIKSYFSQSDTTL